MFVLDLKAIEDESDIKVPGTDDTEEEDLLDERDETLSPTQGKVSLFKIFISIKLNIL